MPNPTATIFVPYHALDDALVDAAWTDAANVFTATPQTLASSAVPRLKFVDTTQAADARAWRLAAAGNAMVWQSVNDAETSSTGSVVLTRQGVVSAPQQPATMVSATGGQALPTHVFTPVAFDTEVSDVGNCFTIAAPTVLTVPAGAAGTYLVIGSVVFTAHVAGTRGVQLQQNGAVAVGSIYTPPALDGAPTAAQVTGLVVLAEGDVVHLLAYQTSGVTLTTAVGSQLQWVKLW